MKNILKKLLLLSFVVITISSNLLLSMQKGFIDLKINEKPRNVTVYEWSKQKAAELVREKRLAILSLLGAIENGWEDIKENLEFEYKDAVTKGESAYEKEFLSEQAQKLIMNILDHPYVKRELDITKISIINNIIVAERRNNKPIKFLSEDPANPINSPEASDGYNIIISPKIAFNGRYSNEVLEASIGHELAHIKCKHIVEEHCFRALYAEQLAFKKTPTDEFTFEAAICDWSRAIEVQADIVGIFNNWIWLESVENFWNNRVLLCIENSIDSNSCEVDINHPSYATRANYFTQIYSAIKKDSELTNTKNNTQNLPKKPEPVSEKNSETKTEQAKNIKNNTTKPNTNFASWLKKLFFPITTKKAFTFFGIFIAAYIILK